MKKFTAKEIAEYLANSGTAFEWEGAAAWWPKLVKWVGFSPAKLTP